MRWRGAISILLRSQLRRQRHLRRHCLMRHPPPIRPMRREHPRRSRRGLTRLSQAQGRPRRSFRRALVGRAPPFRQRHRRPSIFRTCRIAQASPMRVCRAKRFTSSARPNPPQRPRRRRRMAQQFPPRRCRRPHASRHRSLGWKRHPPPLTSARRRGPSTPIRSSATSRSSRKRCTASRSSGSTTPRRRRSRNRSSTASAISTNTRIPTSIAPRTISLHARPMLMRRRGRRRRAFSTRAPSATSSSSAARPRVSTSSPKPGAGATSRKAMRSSSPGWSITPISFPGSSFAVPSAPDCASRRSIIRAR